MELTYQLTDGGYAVYNDGVLWIQQDFQPGVPGIVPFPDAASATAAVEALIAQLQAAASDGDDTGATG